MSAQHTAPSPAINPFLEEMYPLVLFPAGIPFAVGPAVNIICSENAQWLTKTGPG